VKRIVDLALAVVLFLLCLPVMLLLAVLVRLSSRGPALYVQTRVGRGGQPFPIFKFRTMHHNCEKDTGAQWARPGDSRVTWMGRFLRVSHLDELPQLVNVLLGHMSLVGPRPERPEFVPQLSAAVPGYADRLAVRPGVTGLAQLRLHADTDLDSVRRKIVCDRWYVENRTLWLDLRLISCTALKVILLPMTACCRLFGIPDPGRRQAPGASSPHPEEVLAPHVSFEEARMQMETAQ
jgi:lipopolysaccharide/colanic/teichoic acid biosynthesis glycosyltransferase